MPPNAGCRRLTPVDPATGAAVATLVLYPCRAPALTVRFGSYPLEVAMDGPVEGARLPLVVISHGTGGTPLVYRSLAARLARDGFAVALPEHPGNSRSDNSLAGTAANLENRPRHLRLVIDAVHGDAVLGPQLLPGIVGAIGHSMGGYTVLAAAGGRPAAFPRETQDGRAAPVPVTADPRIRSLVLLAPAAAWFLAPGALAEVTAPILMMTAEKDEHAPAEHGEIIRSRLGERARLEHRVVAGAGHFAFLTPFPPEMAVPSFPPAQDPPGFDRAAFQAEMEAEVSAFLQRTLRPEG